MQSNTKVVIKYAAIICIIFVVFIYGILAGRYELFPFSLIQTLKDQVANTVRSGGDVNYEGQVETTALQRLYINKLNLPDQKGRGGAMVSDSLDVFILDRDGKLSYLDLENFGISDINAPQLPMGFESLLESGLTERDDFRMMYFRVSGAHLEKKSDSEFSLYVFHHFYDGQCFSVKLSQLEMNKNGNSISTSNEWREIYKSDPCLNPIPEGLYENERWAFAGLVSGGRILRYDDEHLMLSIGDYQFDGFKVETLSMDPDSPYGKFILVNEKTGDWSIFANGTRNAQGLYQDNDGTMWSTEHGPQGGDELNIIEEGKNLGWPIESLGINYRDRPWGETGRQGRHSNYDAPLYAWVPSIGVSDLVRVEGKKFGLWEGDLLVTSLRGSTIHRLRPDSVNSRILYDEPIPIGHRIRNINVLADGSILLRTDDNFIIHIDDAGPVYESFDYPKFLNENIIASKFSDISTGSGTQLALSGQEIFVRSCADCHSMNQRTLRGPSLANLANREVGSLDDYNYSAVLDRSAKVWDKELLSEYTLTPQQVFPGTTMSAVNLSEDELNKVVDYILESNQE